MGDSYGANIYKIRLGDESKGKSRGFRVMTYLMHESKISTEIILMTIFDKAEDATIKKADASSLIAKIKKQRNLK